MTQEVNTPINEIILYQPNKAVKLEVRLENETVWLTQAPIVDLFGTSRPNITMHFKNIFDEHKLQENSVCKDFLLTVADGKRWFAFFKMMVYKLYGLIEEEVRVVEGKQ
ncbi:hypothetical protein FACS1894161_3420 [Spirochaetia bacterium]|nr:hypothetical protein FACS1894161_3420 [Spirochaetia bacterium]